MLLILVSALVLTTLAPALADMHPAAQDGQRLEDQSADVQTAYRAIHGADAEAQWIEDHNAELEMMMMGSVTDNMYYDRIVAVANARIAASMAMGMDMDDDMSMDDDMDMSDDMDMGDDMDMSDDMDMDLANRIAVDVIGRGTEMEFLAGTDPGVLYGIGISEDEINAMNDMDMM